MLCHTFLFSNRAYLKLIHRDYAAAFRALSGCCTDRTLSRAEALVRSYFASTGDDKHPDSIACRLKLQLALIYSPGSFGPLKSVIEEFEVLSQIKIL